MEYVKKLLADYADGKIDVIEELDEERLPIYAGYENKTVCYKDWQSITVGRLMRI